MPKDEFDFDDPMELTGVGLVTHEDTTDAMCECFIEEFLWLGYNHKQILALFRNPHYVGPNLVLEKRGEPYVREQIARVFHCWGGPVTWSTEHAGCVEQPRAAEASAMPEFPPGSAGSSLSPGVRAGVRANLHSPGEIDRKPDALTDPTGSPIPQIEI